MGWRESNMYLVCEWDGEIEHLSTKLPFGFVLHVGNLYFNRHWTLLKRHKGNLCKHTTTLQEQQSRESIWNPVPQ